MIISISGKIGSGKDTVGSIIHYLVAEKKYREDDSVISDTLKEGFKLTRDYTQVSNWKTKKFADKLKDIACMMLGSTRAQLEDQEFKKTVLGPEWSIEEGMDGMFKQPYIKHMTVREFLQKLGTDAMRNGLHENVWVNSLMSDYKIVHYNLWHDGHYLSNCKICNKQFTGAKLQPICKSCCEENSAVHPNWIITDTRFPNELEAVKAKEGITVRVVRPNQCVCVDDAAIDCLVNCDNKKSTHPSETALDYAKFDYEIVNDGTIEDLIEKVRVILIELNII